MEGQKNKQIHRHLPWEMVKSAMQKNKAWKGIESDRKDDTILD